MTEGRRRRRIRRIAGLVSVGTATALVLVGVPVATGALRHGGPPAVAATQSGVPFPTGTASVAAQPPPAPTTCTVHRLPAPAGPAMSLVTGGDPTGQYIVGRWYPDDSGSRPILIWHDGAVQTVHVPGEDQVFSDITATGDAVGSSFLNGTTSTAFAYLGGQLSQLAGADGNALAVNAQRTIVGTANQRAVVWRSAASPPVNLATPPGDWQGKASGIDDDGTIVGTLHQPGGADHAYVWNPDGSVHELAAPVINGTPVGSSRAFGIHHGWVIGNGAPTGKPAKNRADPAALPLAVRWDPRTGEAHPLTGLDGVPEGVNTYGWVVGTDSKGNAALVSDAGVLTLPPVNPNVQRLDNIAYTISDDGRTIAGQSVLADKARTIVAVVWRCQ
jgi:hypothetical protein